jgi:hypothetical protein
MEKETVTQNSTHMAESLTPTDQLRISRMEDKIDSIYTALMGSKIINDGGMVARLKRVEDKVDKTEQEMNKYKWALLGVCTIVPLLSGIAIFILKQMHILKP